jgi:Primase C terminal 2 (PriCT-2)
MVTKAKRPAAGGFVTPGQLTQVLAGLDIQKFNGQHDDWLRLMMACHHTTGGAACSEFIEWCVGDVDYADDAEIIDNRWDSLNEKMTDGISYRTLNYILCKHGRSDLQVRPPEPPTTSRIEK